MSLCYICHPERQLTRVRYGTEVGDICACLHAGLFKTIGLVLMCNLRKCDGSESSCSMNVHAVEISIT